MTTPVRDPVPFTVLECDQIAAALRAARFEIVCLGARNVVGARGVPGHPATTTREAAFWRIPGSSAWTGTLQLRFPHPRAGEVTGSHMNAPGARFPAFTMRLLHHTRWLRTLDELEAWLGVVSIPIDDAERAAITAGSA